MIGRKAAAIEVEEEKTSIDSGPTAKDSWDDGTSVEDAGTNSRHDVGTVDEPTVEDQARPLPPLSLVPPLPKSASRPVAAKLHVVSGNDTGRDFPLDPARTLTVGRAIDNDVVLTDIAVSRKHLDLSYDGSHWVLRDRGSGNGTLVNDRIEDGSCRLLHGDRIEIGNTVFQLDHPAAAADAPDVGWGQKDDDDEAATVAGRGNRAQSAPQAAVAPPSPRAPASPTARLPPPNRSRNPSGAPPVGATAPLPRPNRTTGAPPVPAARSAAIPAAVPVAIPSGPVTDAAPVASASGPLEIAAITSAPQRHLTTTARVEPRALDPHARYPFIVKPPSPARRYAIYGGIAASVLLVGVIAKFATGPAEPAPMASVVEGSAAPAIATTGAGVASGSAVTDRARPVIDPPAPLDPPIDPPLPAPAGSGAGTAVGAGSGSGSAAIGAAPAPDAVLAPEVRVVVPSAPPTPAPTPPSPPTPPVHVAPAPPPRTPTPAPRPSPPTRATTPKPPKPEPVKPEPPTASASAKIVAAARKKAAQQYAAGNFSAAAETARGALESATASEAATLRSLVSDYTTVGAAMATSGATVETFAAYGRALSADRRLGGDHGPTIRERLGQLAPKAAASYMAKSNFEAAKRAADTAADFGSGTNATVVQVRQSLERKAGELYATGQKILKSQPDEAKALFRRILKMVAPDSPTYQKAYQALNTRTRAADDDE